MFPTISRAYEALIAPARSTSEIWRLILGVAIIVSIYLTFVIFVLTTAAGLGINMDDLYLTGARPMATLVVLVSFAGIPLGIGVVVLTLHRRPLSSVIALNSRQFWTHFQIAASISFVLALASLVLSLFYADPQSNMPFWTWLVWFVPALPLVFLQTASEELLFRGYLQQQLAAGFNARLIWWFLPSLAFGMLHYEPTTYGDNAWLVVASTTVFGLIAADVTARTGSLGAAIGIHFVNNTFALLFVGLNGDLSGLALYVTPFTALDGERMGSFLMVDLVFLSALYYGYVRIMTRLGL